MSHLLIAMTLAMAIGALAGAAEAVVLQLGDILVAEPGTAAISVIDPVTGDKTVISQDGLLAPTNKTIGVAMALDGDVIAIRRTLGLIRINPISGDQTVLSQGGFFRDPWAMAVDKNTGYIYVADSGYDNDRPDINEAGKIIRVDPITGAQELIAAGSPCTIYPDGVACQNVTSAGSYLAHPYGIAMDYTTDPATLVVADMSAFNGQGAIIRLQAVAGGAQTLLWGPATASPPPQVAQSSPLGCPMGIAVEPDGNILTTVFTYPVPSTPTMPPPAGTFYGCTPPGIFRIDLTNNVQRVVNANAPAWAPSHLYAVGDVIRDEVQEYVHRVVTAGISQAATPAWSGTSGGTTTDGSVVWQNIGFGASWLIPFGIAVEPTPNAANPTGHNIIVGDEGFSMVFRLDVTGDFLSAPLAEEASYVTSVHVITVTPQVGVNRPPTRFDGHPGWMLPLGTTQTTMGLATDENATCRYSAQAGVPYASMSNTFATTGSTTHTTVVGGLTNGGIYQFHVRCLDTQNAANTDDFIIAFTVSSSSTTTSTFTGTEHPLSEGGLWESPGSWADLHKSNGAHATGLNALARLVAPPADADQYAEITYDQDPGSAGWVGVATRTQSASNGSGYLAIVYAGEVRLYRTEDTSGLNFTLLAAASANVGIPPRRLRLESEGATHRVYFNGTQVLGHGDTAYTAGQPGLAASVWGGPQVKILSFEGGSLDQPGVDSMPPVRSSGSPTGALPWGTTQVTIGLTTGENATCRYSTQAGVAYGAMSSTFTTTGQTSHTTLVSGLTSGTGYEFFVRCVDAAGNANPDDFLIAFSVAGPTAVTSHFVGVEGPLSEGGLWDSPGSWFDLLKDNGAHAGLTSAMARLVTPALGNDHYSEIVYDQDPGSASWVGVATRIPGANDGSGYLAIAYAGEVRLYRTDDVGGLSFTPLASASANLGAAPRRLRLESEGNAHRVYFNGTLVISHVSASYPAGQPGIAASVFGGPLVKILSFEGGPLQD